MTLLAAGAGAGIAATFNTPLGGVLFALEILLPEVSNRTFLPVVIATGSATYIGRILLGPAPAFIMPVVNLPSPTAVNITEVVALVLLGAIAGVASWLFIRLLVFMEDFFPTLPGNAYAQNIIGMSIIGLMMVGFTHFFGHSYVDGVGYGIIQTVLDGRMHLGGLLLLHRHPGQDDPAGAVHVDQFVEKEFVFVRETDLLSVVFTKLARRNKSAVIVFKGTGTPRIEDIAGIITKRAIADAVIEGFER